MHKQLCLLILVAILVEYQVRAEFFYNHIQPKPEQLAEKDLKCVPGRTIIKVEVVEEKTKGDSDEDDEHGEESNRRSHMNAFTKDETCKICVCSVEGKDEYCSRRPARNVNECLRMAKLMEEFKMNIPLDHERTLAYAIRRDYIWHNDEIPYKSDAKCKRGATYYSNSLTANDTDIDVASDVESLLDYSNKSVCFFCVCSVGGNDVRCISRDPWYCEYYRTIREPNAMRFTYRDAFQQDRPAYFRLLSYRLRRTMDNGLYDVIDSVSNNEISTSCIPFVSEYTDCGQGSLCQECTRCKCNGEGRWSCYRSKENCAEDDAPVDDEVLDNVLQNLDSEINEKRSYNKPRVSPLPRKKVQKLYREPLVIVDDIEKRVEEILRRQKRSEHSKPDVDDTQQKIKFHHTIDEINEDTINGSNTTGLIHAQKIDMIPFPKASRRYNMLDDNSTKDPLQIEFNNPKTYNHIADNKIDSSHVDDKYDFAGREKLLKITNNFNQKAKDKDLSKLVVNELRNGTEIIGDGKAPVMSNITFTAENDTLTAMTFIAGNLLNKLWNIEKDATDDSIETEVMKHKKIADLLELFKEPLTFRQENFLKNALEKLSEAMSKHKNVKDVSLCESVNNIQKTLDSKNSSDENDESVKCASRKHLDTSLEKQENVVVSAVEKINKVLDLVKKFDKIKVNLMDLKHPQHKSAKANLRSIQSSIPTLSKDEKTSLDLFGSILEKITKLLMPNKNKKIKNKILDQNIFLDSNNLREKVKKAFNIDLENFRLTAKDKIVLDYLTKIEKKPKCLLSSNIKPEDLKSTREVESDILLNLSQFFKIKSFADLLKLVQPEQITQAPTTTTERVRSIARTILHSNLSSPGEHTNTSSTKNKLKSHLKSLINDLIELQNEKGAAIKDGDINLVDALPCIFNMLNEDKNLQSKLNNHKSPNLLDKVKSVFETIRRETKSLPQTRRNNIDIESRPKSAVVWERVAKNLDKQQKLLTRRTNDDDKQKSYEETKKEMERMESSGSNAYKSFTNINEAPPSEKLVLLKSLDTDMKQYIGVLKNLQHFIDTEMSIPVEEQSYVKEFIDNAASNIDLDAKVVNALNKPKQTRLNIQKPRYDTKSLDNKKIRPTNMKQKALPNNDFKLTRDQVLNQLIKNRVETYVKIKDLQGTNLNADINYSIAKRILTNLERSNYGLARELYQVFVNTKRRPSELSPVAPKRNFLALKRPLLEFEEQTTNPLPPSAQDLLLKQLLNMKNMRV